MGWGEGFRKVVMSTVPNDSANVLYKLAGTWDPIRLLLKASGAFVIVGWFMLPQTTRVIKFRQCPQFPCN